MTTTRPASKVKDDLGRHRRRLREIGDLIALRHARKVEGRRLYSCDTDDGSIYLEAALPHLRVLGIRVAEWVRVATPLLENDPEHEAVLAPTFDQMWDDYVVAVVRSIRRGHERVVAPPVPDPSAGKIVPKFLNADDMARLLRVTAREREALGMRTIGAIDRSREERAQDRKVKDAAKKKRRQAAGATPRAKSLTATKPWEEHGLGERQWRRLMKAGKLADPRRQEHVRISSAVTFGIFGTDVSRTFANEVDTDRQTAA